MRIIGALLLLVLVACGRETRPDPAEASDDPPTPTSGEVVTTLNPVTVIDDGDGAVLCLGGVDESLPPQCGGPRLVGWDWAELDARTYEQASGVRWGEFVVEGTYNGVEMTPTRVTPRAEVEATDVEPEDPFRTPCPEPEGGWPAVSTLTHADVERTMLRAQRLEGYADAWLDSSRDGRTPEQMDHDAVAGREDYSRWTINVRVTGDSAAAEAELREVWVGALCVTAAEHTEKELRRIQDELHDTPGFLSSGTADQQVELGVIYDDGTLQRRFDKTYGEGVVLVWSALQPVG